MKRERRIRTDETECDATGRRERSVASADVASAGAVISIARVV